MFKGSWRVGLCVLAAAALFGCAEDDGGGAKTEAAHVPRGPQTHFPKREHTMKKTRIALAVLAVLGLALMLSGCPGKGRMMGDASPVQGESVRTA